MTNAAIATGRGIIIPQCRAADWSNDRGGETDGMEGVALGELGCYSADFLLAGGPLLLPPALQTNTGFSFRF